MHDAQEDLLVYAAQEGDGRALGVLYRRYHKALLRYAYKVGGDADIAEDAVQDAWLKFTKNVHQLDDPRAFRSWLYKLVRWRCIDLLRAMNRYSDREEVFDENQYPGSCNASAHADAEELQQFIARLPAREKHIIHLFYIDELKISEIATVLGVPAGTVKSRLSRARDLLKKNINH